MIILNFDFAVLKGLLRREKSLLYEEITAKLEHHSNFRTELSSHW